MDDRRNGGKCVPASMRVPHNCPLCRNHGVIIVLRGHRRHCPYMDCKCKKCLLHKERHKQMLDRQTAICGAEEQNRSRELNGVLPALDIPESFGLTFASFKAAMLHDTDFLQRALDAGMDMNKPLYPYGPTVLQAAVTDGRQSIAEYLLNKGANINVKDSCGYTPLMKAVLRNDIDCTELLAEKGACVNEQSYVWGKSCLHMACETGNIELARILIKHGAYINARSVYESTPLHCVVQNCPTILVTVELCKLLIGEGADLNAKDSHGYTPLMLAVLTKHIECMELFLEKGACMNAQDTRGCTPLHNAITTLQNAWADNSTVEWLIHNGARVDITNNNNQTPFHLAQWNPKVNAIMVKHITKMRVAGLRVGVSSEIVDQDMRVKYLEEMEQIKSTKINEKQTLDVLFSSTGSPIYLSTSEVFFENIMTTPTFEEIFPHYASLLKIQYKLARKRFELLNLASSSLADHRNMTYFHKLPNELREAILEYLNNDELKSLIKSLNISQALDD